MGKLGFVFEIVDDTLTCKFIGNKYLFNKILVFVEKENVKGDFIVGCHSLLNIDEMKIVFLSNDLQFEDFLVFDRPKFKYGKVSLAESTFVDFENLTFWFSPQKYKRVRELMFIDDYNIDLDEEILKRINNLLEFF